MEKLKQQTIECHNFVRNFEGQAPRKLHFKAISLPLLKVFPFFNTKNRQRMFATRAVGWITGLPMIWTGLTKFIGLRDRMLA
jgi:hypothetical protein